MAVSDGRSPVIAVGVEDCVVKFGGVTALNNVTLDLVGPSIVGIVGPNGAGKSTLMGVLSGLVVPSSGRITIGDHDLTGKKARAFALRGVRRSFQNVKLVPSLTLLDNLLVGLGRISREDESRAYELAKTFGFAGDLHKWPSSVPAGVQRLTQVASVALASPSVVLLDEPAAGLTPAECAELARLLKDLATSTLVVLVEHNMQMMYDVAQRVIAIINGAVAADGTVAEVRRHPEFMSAYLGLSAPSAEKAGPTGGATSATAAGASR